MMKIVKRLLCTAGIVLVVLTTQAAVAAATSSTPKVTSAATSTMDFTSRCAQAGVVKCVNFDSDADFNQGVGGTQGAWGARSGEIPRYGTSDYSRIARDTSQSADGASSLRFTIASQTGSDVAGAWFTNFTDDLSYQVGPGQEVFVQWRQRFSPEYLSTQYAGTGGGLANGWKLADISAGDLATCNPSANTSSATCPTTCWDFETVIQDTNQINAPQMYTNCSGPYPYTPLSGYTSNVTVQNAVGCTYPNYPSPPCVKFVANEWMTFQVHIKVGQWDQWNSTIQLWVARDGQPSQLVIDCSPSASNPCNNGMNNAASNGWYLHNSNPTYKLGKVWLLPYHTNKDSSQVTSTAYTWYDDLIISKSQIPDPTPGGATQTVRPNPPTDVAVK
jgi:hypothetical protein